MRYAQQRYKERFGVEISASDLFNMVTYNPAKALMLENKIGAIADEFYADIAIVDKKSENPYDDILSCNPENIIALWSKGHFVFGDERFFKKVSTQANGDAKYTAFKMRDREKIIIGNPKRLIQSFVRTFNINEPVLFDFIPKELQ